MVQHLEYVYILLFISHVKYCMGIDNITMIISQLYSIENYLTIVLHLCTGVKENLTVKLTYSCIIDSSEFCLGPLQHKESSQVGCVRGNNDHCKACPHHPQNPCRETPRSACIVRENMLLWR